MAKATKKAGVVWVSVCDDMGDRYCHLSRSKPRWRIPVNWAGEGFWEARNEDGCEGWLIVGVLKLVRLKNDHAYRVDLIKALQGKPFILQTLKPPKGEK